MTTLSCRHISHHYNRLYGIHPLQSTNVVIAHSPGRASSIQAENLYQLSLASNGTWADTSELNIIMVGGVEGGGLWSWLVYVDLSNAVLPAYLHAGNITTFLQRLLALSFNVFNDRSAPLVIYKSLLLYMLHVDPRLSCCTAACSSNYLWSSPAGQAKQQSQHHPRLASS